MPNVFHLLMRSHLHVGLLLCFGLTLSACKPPQKGMTDYNAKLFAKAIEKGQLEGFEEICLRVHRDMAPGKALLSGVNHCVVSGHFEIPIKAWGVLSEENRFDVASVALAGVHSRLPTVPTGKTMLRFNSQVNKVINRAFSRGETGFDSIILNFQTLMEDRAIRQASEDSDPLFRFLTKDINLADLSEESHNQLILVSSVMDTICGTTWRVDALQQGIGELTEEQKKLVLTVSNLTVRQMIKLNVMTGNLDQSKEVFQKLKTLIGLDMRWGTQEMVAHIAELKRNGTLK